MRIAFELNGEYHHNLPGAKERDERKKKACEKLGIKLIIIWYEDWKMFRPSVEGEIRKILNK